MKIGLFFGSFNPVHNGHVLIAQYFIDNTDIEKIWFILSPLNPLKEPSVLMNEQDRLAILNVIIREFKDFEVNDLEFTLPKPSYTYLTLREIIKKYPDDEFVILMGTDSLNTIYDWKNYEEILTNYSIYLYPRQSSPVDLKPFTKYNITLYPAPEIPISSSLIREFLQQGKSFKSLVPDSIYQYLIKST